MHANLCNLWQFYQRLGAVFPQRSDRSAPVFTPPQTVPLTSYPQNLRNSESRPDATESSAEAEFPTLRYFIIFLADLSSFFFAENDLNCQCNFHPKCRKACVLVSKVDKWASCCRKQVVIWMIDF